jgi:hypothetical protein
MNDKDETLGCEGPAFKMVKPRYTPDKPTLTWDGKASEQGEPVAWMRKTDITEIVDTEPESDGWTPLYTAQPAPAKAEGGTPSFAQLKQILDNLERCHTRDSKAEFLRNWIRDWTHHKIERAQDPAPAGPEMNPLRESERKFIKSMGEKQEKMREAVRALANYQSDYERLYESFVLYRNATVEALKDRDAARAELALAIASVPMTDEQIEPMFRDRMAMPVKGEKDAWFWYAWGVNDAERAHGITQPEQEGATS